MDVYTPAISWVQWECAAGRNSPVGQRKQKQTAITDGTQTEQQQSNVWEKLQTV